MSLPTSTAEVWVSPDHEADRFLPEGPRPVRVGQRDAIAWVNIQTSPDAATGTIHVRFWDTGERLALPVPGRPGFLLPTDRPGTVLVGLTQEVGLFSLESALWQPLLPIPDPHPRTIINDGEIVPGGRAIVFGTKDVQFADPIAQLYLLTLDSPPRLTCLAEQQTCSNGKIFVRDGEQLLLCDIDTPKRNIVRYRLDVNAGTGEYAGVAIDLSPWEGFPDGMVAVGDGSVIVAFYNPYRGGDGRAVRFDLSTGQALQQWITPGSPRVTCPLLVPRADRVYLLLTTATEGMPPALREQSPEAGSLFIADTDIPVASLASITSVVSLG